MPAFNVSNATIRDIFMERDTAFITVTYREGVGNRREERTLRLVAGPRTVIINTNGVPVSAAALRVGMTINAAVSTAMTRSIPPQAAAYGIRITGRPQQENMTTGRIVSIDQNNRSFTTISDRDASSIIQFNVPESAVIFSRTGRVMNFRGLSVGMRVRVRHANFMTASIPPQTTAFEVRVL